MDPRAEDLTLKRLRLFARLIFVWAVIIVLRLVYLQVIDHVHYQRLAERQQERLVDLPAQRGSILDRNGMPLAISVPVESVCINPLKVKDIAIAARILSSVLQVPENELLSRITTAKEASRGFLWVKRKVTEAEAVRLRAHKLEYVEFREESTRSYPKSELAAHVLGGVNFQERGNGGIEQALDEELAGKPGLMRTTADVLRNVFDSRVHSDPVPGKDLTLTLDERIQYVAEAELAKAVASSDAHSGSLVAMDPRTGEILALANYPTFDPNKAPSGPADQKARANLSVTAPFEPGSVFKVITVATALETTRVTPETPFFCNNGAFTLFRRVIHDAKPHGTLTLTEVLAKSSNIGSIKAALMVGNEKFYQYIRAFGFGQKTGLPLPGESAGMLRKTNRWIPSSIGSIAMGHELSTTTVQLARACSVIANGGFLVKPEIVRDPQAKTSPVQVLKPATAMKMRIMMRTVVDKGTGSRARPLGYSAAGKTGSAQIYDAVNHVYTHRYNGSFMGFAPVTNPRIVIVVTLNGTRSGSMGFGGIVAAPVFQKVAAAALRILDVPPDIPDDKLSGQSHEPEADLASPEGAQPPVEDDQLPVLNASLDTTTPGEEWTGPRAPNLIGRTKREVLRQALSLGLPLQIAGSGVVRRQDPMPGTPLPPGQAIKVHFAR